MINRTVTRPVRADYVARERSQQSTVIDPTTWDPPSVVLGEVVHVGDAAPTLAHRAKRLPARVVPAFVNTREDKPQSLLQGVAAASTIALPLFGVWWLLWVYLTPVAVLAAVVLLALQAGLVHKPKRSPLRFFGLVFLSIIMWPGRAIVHCCCGFRRM